METQQDSSVIADAVTEAPIQQKSSQELLGVDSRFCWKKKEIFDRYMENKNDKKVQLEYFNHITNTSTRQYAMIAKITFDRLSLHLPIKKKT